MKGAKTMDKIKVVYLAQFSAPEVREIPNEGDAFRELIGGYMELVPIKEYADGRQLLVVCDEEGKLKGKFPNFPLIYNGVLYDWACGDVVLTMGYGEEFVGADSDIKDIMEYLHNGAIIS